MATLNPGTLVQSKTVMETSQRTTSAVIVNPPSSGPLPPQESWSVS